MTQVMKLLFYNDEASKTVAQIFFAESRKRIHFLWKGKNNLILQQSLGYEIP